MLLLQSNTTCW